MESFRDIALRLVEPISNASVIILWIFYLNSDVSDGSRSSSPVLTKAISQADRRRDEVVALAPVVMRQRAAPTKGPLRRNRQAHPYDLRHHSMLLEREDADRIEEWTSPRRPTSLHQMSLSENIIDYDVIPFFFFLSFLLSFFPFYDSKTYFISARYCN